MTDDINKKIINIFSAHKKARPCSGNQVCESAEGYSYVTIKADDNGRHFDEEKLLKNASSFYYIVKVMVKEGKHPYINNFKISGDKVLDFVKMYTDGKGEGQIIEIDKFYPEDWA
ncbi:MAG: hypothetical protein A2Y25_09030 [Candidatus Melainabacteria bacterium GWF2_37_15]|nr:MAG: hypothetical protein A2Y25_09030 [Candidatus Melainabacteria bacterium GWF2_37_15]